MRFFKIIHMAWHAFENNLPIIIAIRLTMITKRSRVVASYRLNDWNNHHVPFVLEFFTLDLPCSHSKMRIAW